MCEKKPPGTNKAYALSVYILLILGCIMPITLPIGIILAYTMRHEAKGTTGGAHLEYLITTFWISMGGVLAGLASLALGELMAGDTPIIAFAPVALWGITVLWWIIRLIYGLICLLKD